MEKQLLEERKKIQTELRDLRQLGVLVKISLPEGLVADGTKMDNPTIRVEQFRSSVTVPLLPHIFFNESSTVIPARYRRITAAERATYSTVRLATAQPVEVYRHILNIIGKRLQERPNARLTLKGFNPTSGVESTVKKLGLQRAEAVSDYFQDVWKIAGSRINVTTQDIAPPANADAETEARRVDISSDDPAIMQALTLESVYQSVLPQALRFSLDINAGAGLKQWGLEVSQFQGNEIVSLFNIEGTNEYPKEYVWRIDEHPNSVPTVSGTIETEVEVTDVNNRNADTPIQTTPVEVVMLADKVSKKTPDTRVDIVTAVVPLGKTLAESETLLGLKSTLAPGSTILAEGWADGANEQSLNTNAADALAREAAQILGANATTVSSKKRVEWMKPLHNDGGSPEGRLYNRAVRLEVRTPIRY